VLSRPAQKAKKVSARDLRINAKERKARLRLVFGIDRSSLAEQRQRLDREVSEFFESITYRDRDGVFGGDIVLHCKLPPEDLHPSEWEPTPAAFSTSQVSDFEDGRDGRRKQKSR
jgi:hypothetical protein